MIFIATFKKGITLNSCQFYEWLSLSLDYVAVGDVLPCNLPRQRGNILDLANHHRPRYHTDFNPFTDRIYAENIHNHAEPDLMSVVL